MDLEKNNLFNIIIKHQITDHQGFMLKIQLKQHKVIQMGFQRMNIKIKENFRALIH
jgi:hypothetical protein